MMGCSESKNHSKEGSAELPESVARRMKSRPPQNNLLSIEARRYGTYSRSTKSVYRHNIRIMRNLIASPDWFFKCESRITSRHRIAFECPDKLYIENSRHCYTVRGPRGEPTLLYSLDHHQQHNADWSYVAQLTVPRAGTNNPMLPASALRLLLVSNSWLEVRNDRTGKLVECLDLQSPDSPGIRFTKLHWDPNLHQVIVVSAMPDCGLETLRDLLVLELGPEIRIALRVPILKRVFGHNCMDVFLSEGMLKVLYCGETVKIYDFNWICRNNRIAKGARDKVLYIRDLGEPVYVVNGTNEMLQFGGIPWRYITSSLRQREYSVFTMDHRKIATFPRPAHQNIRVSFHPDDSGTILHSDEKAITVTTDDNTNEERLEKLRVLELRGSVWPEQWLKFLQEGGQGCPARMETPEPSRPIDENKRTIFAEHFETELNLDLLMGNDVRDSKRRAVIQFFDSETGLPIKTMHFSRKLPKGMKCMIALDLDVLVVLTARENDREGECHVYRLLHRDDWGSRTPYELHRVPSLAR